MKVEKLSKITISLGDYPLTTNASFNELLTTYTDFNIKGKVYHPKSQEEVERIANKLCNSEIELTTYQTIIRNFLSNETPYNGLLLFHGLGTGKTCTAITVAEEHRKFLKQSGLVVKHGPKYHEKKIYVLGGPNIKSNFRKQLFDVSQLKKNGNEWTCKSCVGNAFLREINPANLDISKEDIVKRVNEIIKRYYKFMGYIEFANRINELKKSGAMIANEFEHSMIIIDEVHNIKEVDDTDTKPSKALDLITEHTTVKLLLLSATPMFNDVSEIVWISNLLNRNDKKYTIVEKDFFENGELIEGQEEDFIHHLRGYVSFVKGENPYTFPYRVYPHLKSPVITVEGKKIKPIRTPVYPIQMSEYQSKVYLDAYEKHSDKFETQHLLGILNMTYPDSNKEVRLDEYMTEKLGTYSYSPTQIKCFDQEHLKTYSSKLYTICKHIKNSTGIVLIYTRLIDMGVIPMALSLESMGFKNIHKNLMNTPKTQGSYCLITGSKLLSPDNEEFIRRINSEDNVNGEKIKVVIITESASEGVDFKNIRQIHIMDPWWHLNRNEQIIGRGIRLCSHKNLPFRHRNAQIFLYVSLLAKEDKEVIDHYYYRYAEEKAEKIGKITRLIKQNAIDCVMNHLQFQSVEKMDLTVKQELSDGTVIDYPIGDNSFSVMCDFMRCEYKCSYKEQAITSESKLFDINRTIEKIQKLFKHGYIYSKKDLFRELNMNTPVSYYEMYSALSQLVELKTECRDMLQRQGYLVNYGVYYMFQPSQLTGQIPGYERRVPMNNNPHSIIIRPLPPVMEVVASSLIETMYQKYQRATGNTGDDWYSTIPNAKKHLKQLFDHNKIRMQDDLFDQCIVDNLVELLLYEECYELINHIFTTTTEFTEKIKRYFEEKMTTPDQLQLWNDTKIVHLEKKKSDVKWVVIEKKTKKRLRTCWETWLVASRT